MPYTPLKRFAKPEVDAKLKAITKMGEYLYTNSGGGSGSVSTVSVVSANGFSGSVATATSTPDITLSTTVTGILKGNGTAISAAVAGTDYQAPLSGTGFVKITGSTISYDNSTYASTTTPTFVTSITTPLIIGGSSTTQTLTHKTTTGVGATGADHIFQVGNNGATEAMRILNNAQIKVSNGSKSIPTLSFANDATSGFYSRGTGNFGFSAGGALVMEYASSGLQLNSSSQIAWSSGQSDIASVDVGISRLASGKIGISTGGVGGSSGTLIAGNVGIGTTSPQASLDVVNNFYIRNSAGVAGSGYGIEASTNSSTPRFDFVVNGAYAGSLEASGSNFNFKNNLSNTGNISFNTSIAGVGASRLYIQNNGNIGIGQTTPLSKLHIAASTATANTASLQINAGTRETVARAGTMVYESGKFVMAADGLELGGSILFGTNDTYSIGTSNSNRPLIIRAQAMYPGNIIVFGGGAGTTLYGPSDGVLRLSNSAVSDFSRLQFGGTTSSFPALKRSGVNLSVRLADDSGDGGFSAGASSFSSDVTIAASSRLGFSGRSNIYSLADGNIGLYNNAASGFGLLQFGGAASTFPAIKRSTTTLQVRLADDSADASIKANDITSTGVVILQGYTVATLPTGVIGATAYVTDSLTPTFGSTVVGGGAVVMKVFYNGTNWIVG